MSVPILSLSSVANADIYFSGRLYVQAWLTASADNKQAALNDATRLINRFNYLGRKTVESQDNEWPRHNVRINCVSLDDSIIPNDILLAQYETAFALISGVNVEKELRSMGVTSRGYSSVRITYDPNRSGIWLTLGIPSYTAWAYLLPYLNREADGTIKLHRVS